MVENLSNGSCLFIDGLVGVFNFAVVDGLEFSAAQVFEVV